MFLMVVGEAKDGYYMNLESAQRGYWRTTHGSHALLYALGTTYNLDARTFLYGTITYVNNSRNGTFSVFATPRDSSSATSPMAGESQTGVYVGMMHTF